MKRNKPSQNLLFKLIPPSSSWLRTEFWGWFKDQKAYTPIPIAYNAPQYDEKTARLIPHISYNAFPDLNHRGKDKLYSEPPNGAKYLWPLGCVFNPYGVFKSNDDEPNWVCEPRDPKLEELYSLSLYFELTHARLAFTHYKILLRNRELGPLYSELANIMKSGDMIEVPLIPDLAGSVLQQLWRKLHEGFKTTLIIDEACSLLVTVALCGTTFEKRWVAQEEQHLPGFSDFYNQLRNNAESSFGKLEACNTNSERSTWATNVIMLGLVNYSIDRPLDEENFDFIKEAIVAKYGADYFDSVKEYIRVVKYKDDITRYKFPATTIWEMLQDVLEAHLVAIEHKRGIIDDLEMPFRCGIETGFSPTNTYM
jgi:hypothetical protein